MPLLLGGVSIVQHSAIEFDRSGYRPCEVFQVPLGAFASGQFLKGQNGKNLLQVELIDCDARMVVFQRVTDFERPA